MQEASAEGTVPDRLLDLEGPHAVLVNGHDLDTVVSLRRLELHVRPLQSVSDVV